jgi:ketosteroid isomerase-like protein
MLAENTLTANKATVERYMEGFRNSDHELILSCLTDDVVWDIPGAFHIVGKEAFDREIENAAFVGRPAITVTRMTAENNVVVAEGAVRVQRKAGDFLNLVFCDVFVMQRGKIQQLISYLVPIDDAGALA